MRKRIDITGQRFGRLTTVKEVHSSKHRRYYLCQCDCGNVKIVSMDQLRSGKTQSCGCLNQEITSKTNTMDLTGARFGRLTVIGRSKKHHKTQTHAIWTCRCDCGNVVEVMSTYLINGETKSCGCWKKDHGRILQKYDNKNFRKNGTFIPALKSKVRSDSSTGFKGVSVEENGKYRASLTIGGKRVYLGKYIKLEDAVKARKMGEEKYFRPVITEFFQNINRKP
ncbi:hypothetical protein [Sporolactobacillus pectinivorans]|uniref:hypothetical protein n=1 Tax=Sporolactobacillus pectinivorans TaxID=1591408 RepID=UPI000C26148F|nr:hypothetical protein [Sporolactobacillus pectinivorans]